MEDKEPRPIPGECEHCASSNTDAIRGEAFTRYHCYACGHAWIVKDAES